MTATVAPPVPDVPRISARGGLTWGLRALDRVVGDLRPGRVHIIGARPASGKTSFLLCWLDRHVRAVERAFERGGDRFWRMPRRVAVFLTERSPEVARLSWAALRLGYDMDAVTSEEWKVLPIGVEEKVERELKWIDHVERKQGWVTFHDIGRPTVRAVGDALADQAIAHNGAGPEVVVFDYIQRIRPEGRQNKFDAVGDAAHLFQTLAQQLGIVVLVASQLKRKGDGVFDKYRPPNLEDFKLSGDIEEVADVALGFFRPLQKMTAKDEREIRAGHCDLERFKVHDTMAIKVVKHRWRGPANDRILWVRHLDGLIEDMPATLPPNAGDAWEPEFEDGVPF